MRAMILVATLLACASNAAQAQSKPNERKGFWVGFGLGGGSFGIECDICTDDRVNGGTGYVRLGGTLSRHLLLGVEVNAWVNPSDAVDESIGNGSVVLLWYPSATGALYLKFGLGGMTYSGDDGVDVLTATAPTFSIGLGYEFRVGRNISLVPYMNTFGSSEVDVEINGVSFGNVPLTLNVFELGLGLTWH